MSLRLDDPETLRRAAEFVSKASGFQCSTVTPLQLQSALRALQLKLVADETEGDAAVVGTKKRTTSNRARSNSKSRTAAKTYAAS